MSEYEGRERRSESWGRRDHDHTCEVNQKNMKEWVSAKICIATKPTKGKLALLILLLGSTLALSGFSAINSISASGEARHNEEEISEVKAEHEAFKQDVAEIKEDIGDIKSYMRQQTQVMKALGHELGVEVTIE